MLSRADMNLLPIIPIRYTQLTYYLKSDSYAHQRTKLPLSILCLSSGPENAIYLFSMY